MSQVNVSRSIGIGFIGAALLVAGVVFLTGCSGYRHVENFSTTDAEGNTVSTARTIEGHGDPGAAKLSKDYPPPLYLAPGEAERADGLRARGHTVIVTELPKYLSNDQILAEIAWHTTNMSRFKPGTREHGNAAEPRRKWIEEAERRGLSWR